MQRMHIVSLIGLISMMSIQAAGSDINVTIIPVKSEVSGPENRIKKIIEINKAAKGPVIDGKLDDECWKHAVVADNFVQLGSDAPAKEQTTARLTYDDKALYIAFVCRESRMGKILATKKEHDDDVWRDDCVEIFLDTNHDHLSYYQFIVNTLGTRQEGCRDAAGKLDQKWNCEWNAGISIQKDRWTAEVAIPFQSINARPGYWGINVCREEQPVGELSCWAKQMRRFGSLPEELALFGDAIFEGVPFKVTSLFTGNQGWGKNLLKMEIENRGDKEATWSLIVTAASPEGKQSVAKSDPFELGPKASRSIELSYEIPRLVPGCWLIEVSIRDVSANRSYAMGKFPFEVKESSPFLISGRVIVGPEYVVPARLQAIIGTVTLKEAVCRISVLDTKGEQQAQKDIPLYPTLYPRGEADVRIDISGLPEGRYVIAAQVVDKAGKAITDKTEKTIIKIPGPFEEIDRGPTNFVENASFEIVNDEGEAEGWAGAWWASKTSGLSEVPVKDFLSVDDSTAKDGKRSIRIKSTRRGQVGTGEVLTVRTTKPIPITPGVSYKLTCWWKSDGIVGIGKIWAQTPKRQFLFKGTINGTNPDWILDETTFTPDEGETSCILNFSLHGKDGTLWIDQITFAEEEPSLRTILPPNVFNAEGICLLDGNVEGKGLTLAVEASDAESGQKLGSATVPVDDKKVGFKIPGLVMDRKCRLAARLLNPSGVIVDTRKSTVFGAPFEN